MKIVIIIIIIVVVVVVVVFKDLAPWPVPWTGDQPDARPLPVQDNTTEKDADTYSCLKRGSNRNPSVREVEDSTCFRPRCHWDIIIMV
jgi:hypothetical protein